MRDCKVTVRISLLAFCGESVSQNIRVLEEWSTRLLWFVKLFSLIRVKFCSRNYYPDGEWSSPIPCMSYGSLLYQFLTEPNHLIRDNRPQKSRVEWNLTKKFFFFFKQFELLRIFWNARRNERHQGKFTWWMSMIYFAFAFINFKYQNYHKNFKFQPNWWQNFIKKKIKIPDKPKCKSIENNLK